MKQISIEKVFDIKNYKHLSTPEIKEAGKILTELKKKFKV